MLRVGITGQAGFVGNHLYNTLGLFPEKYERVDFQRNFFENSEQLKNFVSSCDVIVHLAAKNRHNDPEVIYQTNIGLVDNLIEACEASNSKPHILFSSSTQEEKDNLYGKSKKEGREHFIKWAEKVDASFTGLIIPNVFGPFGNPYYNSFIATFSHQLTHNEEPTIQVDGEVKLIYVNELVAEFIKHINKTNQGNSERNSVQVSHTSEVKVSSVLSLLKSYHDLYFMKGEIPSLDNEFEKNLFTTFLCYIDHSLFFPFHLKLNTDQRGSFVETVRLNSGGQVSFSTTAPGITRGNHFHTRKAERFAVIKGKAQIELRKIGTGEIMSFELDGGAPSFVDMPIWYTHNITNIGEEELYTIFWINEHYNPEDPDTYMENVHLTNT